MVPESGFALFMSCPLLGSWVQPCMLLNFVIGFTWNWFSLTIHSAGPRMLNLMSFFSMEFFTRPETTLISFFPGLSNGVMMICRSASMKLLSGVPLTKTVSTTGEFQPL